MQIYLYFCEKMYIFAKDRYLYLRIRLQTCSFLSLVGRVFIEGLTSLPTSMKTLEDENNVLNRN